MVPDGYHRLDEAFRIFAREQNGHIDEKCFPYIDTTDEYRRLVIDAEYYKNSTNIDLPPPVTIIDMGHAPNEVWFNPPFVSKFTCEVYLEKFLSLEGMLPDLARKFRTLFEVGKATAYFFQKNRRFRVPSVDWRPSVRNGANLEFSFFSDSAFFAGGKRILYTDAFAQNKAENKKSINIVSTDNKKPSPQLKIAMDHLWNEAGKNIKALMELTVTQRLAVKGGYSYSTGRRAKAELIKHHALKCNHDCS